MTCISVVFITAHHFEISSLLEEVLYMTLINPPFFLRGARAIHTTGLHTVGTYSVY